MPDKLEQNITESIAQTFGFQSFKIELVCRYCNTRFQKDYVSTPINERMISHARRHKIGRGMPVGH